MRVVAVTNKRTTHRQLSTAKETVGGCVAGGWVRDCFNNHPISIHAATAPSIDVTIRTQARQSARWVSTAVAR